MALWFMVFAGSAAASVSPWSALIYTGRWSSRKDLGKPRKPRNGESAVRGCGGAGWSLLRRDPDSLQSSLESADPSSPGAPLRP